MDTQSTIIPQQPVRIKLPTSSDARDVVSFARQAAKKSLHFFMTSVLERSATEEVCDVLQTSDARTRVLMLAAHEVRPLAEGLILWKVVTNGVVPAIQIIGLDSCPVDPETAQNDTFRWLFGSIPVSLPSASRADYIFLVRSRMVLVATPERKRRAA